MMCEKKAPPSLMGEGFWGGGKPATIWIAVYD